MAKTPEKRISDLRNTLQQQGKLDPDGGVVTLRLADDWTVDVSRRMWEDPAVQELLERIWGVKGKVDDEQGSV